MLNLEIKSLDIKRRGNNIEKKSIIFNIVVCPFYRADNSVKAKKY